MTSSTDPLRTLLVHADAGVADCRDTAPVTLPIAMSSTFTQRVPADLAPLIARHVEAAAAAGGHGHAEGEENEYIYSRMTTPVVTRVEAVLGALEGGYPGSTGPAHAVVYASGLAALFAVMHHYTPRRIVTQLGYHGTFAGLREYLRNRPGCVHVALSPTDTLPADLGAGDLVLLESPLNPYGDVTDLASVSSSVRAAGARLVVDATLAPPPLQFCLSFPGVDAVVHSATKFYGGHSDILGGVVATRDAATARALRGERTVVGSTLGSLEAWLLLRSLRTLTLRVRAQAATAAKLARWFAKVVDGEVPGLEGTLARVRHASLGPQPEWVKRQMAGGHSPVLAVELASRDAARAVPHLLHLARPATSLGGVETLAEWRFQHDPTMPETLVRVSVGLEDVEDLKADWTRALVAAKQIAEEAAAMAAKA
ncbi:hypothetical protein H9P43_007994 [Blastocladiella emersonii ATCC 22665]|nr:hypothetical protein H9P43_007994 [Blastocladiella emersonii ATCC 22665]